MANWNYNDGNYRITDGTAGITSVRVIQKPDGYGGYNVSYGITGSLASYHIHYKRNGMRVTALRYKSGATAQGDNILTSTGQTLAELFRECKDRAGNVVYPNTLAMLQAIRNANLAAPKDLRNEIA